MATLFSEFLLIFFGDHPIRYVFATSSVAASSATLYGVIKSYVARGRCLTGFKRKGCCYFYSNDRDLVWHAPVRTESVRFLYSALSFLTILIDFIRIAGLGERVVQGFTAFPAAFASVVFVVAAIDHVVLYTTH